jgi:hypothetical protein
MALLPYPAHYGAALSLQLFFKKDFNIMNYVDLHTPLYAQIHLLQDIIRHGRHREHF